MTLIRQDKAMKVTQLFASIRSQFRSSNSSSGRLLVPGLPWSNRARNGRSRVTGVAYLSETAKKKPEYRIKEAFLNSGWVVRTHLADIRFRAPELEQRKVAFAFRDESETLHQHEGIYEAFGGQGALFKLKGRDEIFNSNLISVLAVEPAAV